MSSKVVSGFIEKKKEYHTQRWHDYVDCINETISKYLVDNPPLEERHFLHMEKDAENLVKEYGISMEDAEILAVVNFCQDVSKTAKGREGSYSMNGDYDENVLKLLKRLSEKALEGFTEETKRKIKFA